MHTACDATDGEDVAKNAVSNLRGPGMFKDSIHTCWKTGMERGSIH